MPVGGPEVIMSHSAVTAATLLCIIICISFTKISLFHDNIREISSLSGKYWSTVQGVKCKTHHRINIPHLMMRLWPQSGCIGFRVRVRVRVRVRCVRVHVQYHLSSSSAAAATPLVSVDAVTPQTAVTGLCLMAELSTVENIFPFIFWKCIFQMCTYFCIF